MDTRHHFLRKPATLTDVTDEKKNGGACGRVHFFRIPASKPWNP